MQTLTGIEYLKAEIACKHDKAYEKTTWDERLAHFNEMDLTSPKTFKNASNPIGLRSAVQAYLDTAEGKPSGYMVSLDACSSGLQILSLLVSCPTSFSLCGGNHDDCVDSYTTIYDSMNLHGALTRKQVKQAIMTSLYGSTAMPEITFGNNVDMFYETMEQMAPGAWDLNLGLQELWDEISGPNYDWVMPDNFHACIETQDKELIEFTFLGEKFAVNQKINARPDFHKGLGPNLIHSIDGMVVREMFRRCMFNPEKVTKLIDLIMKNDIKPVKETPNSKMVEILWDHFIVTGFLSARILDYLDEDSLGLVSTLEIAKLIQTLPEKPFELVSVHDCFRCHPNYGNDLRRQYNTILADLNDSELLADMAKQVAHNKIKTRKVGKIDRQVILDSNYALA